MESHGFEPMTASLVGAVKSLSLGAGQQRHCRSWVNLIKLLQVQFTIVAIVLESITTTATLINYMCKSYIKLTPGCLIKN